MWRCGCAMAWVRFCGVCGCVWALWRCCWVVRAGCRTEIMRDGLEAVGCDMGVRTLALWRRLQDRNHDRWVGGGWVCYGSVRCECVSARFCAFLRAPLYFVAWRLVAVWFCGVSCGRVCAAVCLLRSLRGVVAGRLMCLMCRVLVAGCSKDAHPWSCRPLLVSHGRLA